MTIGERIKKARKNKGWSQSELGQVLGVSQQMIAQFENSKRRPKLETLDKIASALDVGVLDLLGDIVLSPDADSDHSKTKVNYLATFKAMLESLGYDVEFRRREDLYIIFKNNKVFCTFDTGDYFELINKVLDDIKYYITLKSFPNIDYMSDTSDESNS